MIAGTKLSLLVPDQFLLYHYLGNLNALLWVDVLNTGGKTARIHRVDCYITGEDGGLSANIPATTFVSRTHEGKVEFPVGVVVVKPEDHWAETVHCFRGWTDAEEEEVNEIILAIRESIQSRVTPQQTAPIEAEPALAQRAVRFFENKFPLVKGHYNLIVALLGESSTPLLVSGYRFTLYENQLRTMRSAAENYKIGAGLYFALPDPMLNVWPKLKPLPDHDAKRIYQRVARQQP
jgi:hypothetical protein